MLDGICGGQGGIGTDFSINISVSRCQNSPLLYNHLSNVISAM
jgi:hypothetical protein